MRLTLAVAGLFAIANAAVIGTSVATREHETRALEPRQTYPPFCSHGNGPGWDGFLKAHAAFTKLWASTPAGFCVASNNWACVVCEYNYLWFWPDETAAGKTVCITRDQFGAAATLFNGVARQGLDSCSIRVANVGHWGFGNIIGDPFFYNRACVNRC